ncbi:MAG: hypothetical protein GY758_21965 [Fuerstiella sp.]|nr:hypothetical protein [Fuerstiella sp.]MCP4509534.1 hypothetical protein [Fuerstiella sp.]
MSLSAVMLSEGFQWRQTPLVGIMRSGRIPSECVSSWFLCETTDLNHTTTCCSVCSQDFGFRYGGGDACYCCRRPVDPQIGYIAAVVFGAHGRSDLAKQLIQELHSSYIAFPDRPSAKQLLQQLQTEDSSKGVGTANAAVGEPKSDTEDIQPESRQGRLLYSPSAASASMIT